MKRRRPGFISFLTSTLIAASAFVGIYVLILMADPQSILNPFPPPTLPSRLVLATQTQTLSPPTITEVITLAPPTLTSEPEIEATLISTDNEVQLDVLASPTLPQPDPTSTSTVQVEATATQLSYEYILQAGSIGYTTQFAHPDLGCNWLGVAGTVYDADGNPGIDLIAHVEGPNEFMMDSITGSKMEYGEAGYEITLGDSSFDSVGEYSIQLLNILGKPVSEEIAVGTFAGCDRNLILVNFVETE